MPSAAAFVSNLSLASTTTSVKNGIQENADDPSTMRKQYRGTAILFLTSAAAVISSAVPTGYNTGVLNSPQQTPNRTMQLITAQPSNVTFGTSVHSQEVHLLFFFMIIQQFSNESIFERYGFVLSESEVSVLWSTIVSVFLIGGMVGSLLAGWLCNTFGRRGAILRVNVLGIVSSILFATCQSASSVEMLIIGRFLIGIFGGFSTSAIPVYLTEISPISLRGPLGVLQPLGMNFGLLFSLVLGRDSILGNDWGWPYLLGLFIFPVVIASVILAFCPESPKFLYAIMRNSDESLKALSRLRNLPITDLEEDVMEMKKELKQSMKCPSWSFIRVITSSEIRMPLILLCVMHAGQQLSGINAVFYYSTGIFKKAGMSQEESQYASIGAGLTNFLMSAISTFLIAKFGRKSLFLTSCAFVIAFLVGLTTSFTFMDFATFVPFFAVAFLLLFVLTFGLGLGPIPFFIGAELFLPGPRPVAMSIGCTINWACNFLVGVSFPSLQSAIGHYSFLLFVGITFCVCAVIYTFLPETKDKSFDAIMASFHPSKSRRSSEVDIEDAQMLEPIKGPTDQV